MTSNTAQSYDEWRRAVSRNIESIASLEKDEERRLSGLHKVSHMIGWFVETIHFAILQLQLVLVWFAWNSYVTIKFDPYPYGLLSAVLALEAVLGTSFVLIRLFPVSTRETN